MPISSRRHNFTFYGKTVRYMIRRWLESLGDAVRIMIEIIRLFLVWLSSVCNDYVVIMINVQWFWIVIRSCKFDYSKPTALDQLLSIFVGESLSLSKIYLTLSLSAIFYSAINLAFDFHRAISELFFVTFFTTHISLRCKFSYAFLVDLANAFYRITHDVLSFLSGRSPSKKAAKDESEDCNTL